MFKHVTDKIIGKNGRTISVTSKKFDLGHTWLYTECVTLMNEHHYWITDTRVPKIGEPCMCGKYKFHGEE